MLTSNRSIHLVLFFAALFSSLGWGAESTGSLTGSVSNSATRNLLQGARVELPSLGINTLTDATGRYGFSSLPDGTHQIVVTYLGLDSEGGEVTISAGRRAERNFELTTNIYKLDAFKVTGEREGAAAAITAERNSDNVKNVVATDSFGTLPNMSASEIAIQLPGVAATLTGAGLIDGLSIRGMSAALNTIQMDGVLLTGRDDGLNRANNLYVYTSMMFEQVELTKGHRPDNNADSLGGTLNLKSRSTLSMTEKRRLSYNFSGRLAPSFTEQIPLREQHRLHPLLNVGHQEVFNLAGGHRNLGVSVNLFYSEHATGWFQTAREFQNTPAGSPAYLYDYRTSDTYNPHFQKSINVKLDFRLSPRTKFALNAIANDNNEKFRRQWIVRAFTTQQVGTTGTAGILPDYTDRITRVRAAPGSTIDITTSGPNNVFVRMRNLDFNGEQEFGRLRLDYKASYNQTHVNRGSGTGGELTNRITGVGWILDRTESDLYPKFIQTEGPDFTNGANYRPNGQLVNNNRHNDFEVSLLGAHARYALPTRFDASLKVGGQWREQAAADVDMSKRWNYIGTGPLPTSPDVLMFDTVKTGRRMPLWQVSDFISTRTPADPTLWREDAYWGEQQKFIGTRTVTETVTAGYVMGQAKIGGTGILAGVRTEKTDTESAGWVRARVGSTVAQQQADPVGSAQRDYASTHRRIEGTYTKSFPSVHLNHNITRNLKARLSWSTSFGRPALNNFLPNETVNETQQTLTINNPSLLPQTASNWDATLEYYFEPVGNLSVGWFHKTIKDYIVRNTVAGTVSTGADNGYDGEYGGFTILTSSNAGTATVQGWEFSYQQQFTFLPGLLRGLSLGANYTLIETRGDFGGNASRKTGEVPGFIPRVANLNLGWRYRSFSARYSMNDTASYITSFTAAGAAGNLYRFERTTVNVGVAYHYRPWAVFTLDLSNMTNATQSTYRGVRDRVQMVNIPGKTITFGLNGRF